MNVNEILKGFLDQQQGGHENTFIIKQMIKTTLGNLGVSHPTVRVKSLNDSDILVTDIFYMTSSFEKFHVKADAAIVAKFFAGSKKKDVVKVYDTTL